jgi:hypothetical protein
MPTVTAHLLIRVGPGFRDAPLFPVRAGVRLGVCGTAILKLKTHEELTP